MRRCLHCGEGGEGGEGGGDIKAGDVCRYLGATVQVEQPVIGSE